MKRFNQLTEKQMTKTDGGSLILAAIAIGGSTLAAAGAGIGVGTHLEKQKQ